MGEPTATDRAGSIYTGDDITDAERRLGLERQSGYHQRHALATLRRPRRHPVAETARLLAGHPGATVCGPDAFDGYRRFWEPGTTTTTRPRLRHQPITLLRTTGRKWASYRHSIVAGSIYTGDDISGENAPSAWNCNLDTVNGALATLRRPRRHPGGIEAAAGTPWGNGLRHAFRAGWF